MRHGRNLTIGNTSARISPSNLSKEAWRRVARLARKLEAQPAAKEPPTIRAIHAGEPYAGRSPPSGCYPRHAPCDGLLVSVGDDQGDVVIPAAEVRAELDKLKRPPRPTEFDHHLVALQRRMKAQGKPAAEIRAAVRNIRQKSAQRAKAAHIKPLTPG